MELPRWSDSRPRQIGDSMERTRTSCYGPRDNRVRGWVELLRSIDELLSGADGFYESVFESMRLAAPAGISEPTRAVAQPGEPAVAPPTTAEAEMLRAVAAGMALVAAYRSHGHLAARLAPLASAPPRDPSLDPR